MNPGRWLVLAVAAALAVVGCVKEDSGPTVAQFRMPDNQVAGWTQPDADGYETFAGQALYTPMDGGAQPYLDHGVVLTSMQFQRSADTTKNAKLLAMDVGSPSAATSLYQFKRDENPDTSMRVSCRYSIGNAVIVDYTSYYFAVAHFGRHFFQIELSGVTDRATAVAAIEAWLGYWEGKSGS